MTKAINIIISDDGPNARFIEIENDAGKSIKIGERLPGGDYFTKIRITLDDIYSMEE